MFSDIFIGTLAGREAPSGLEGKKIYIVKYVDREHWSRKEHPWTPKLGTRRIRSDVKDCLLGFSTPFGNAETERQVARLRSTL